MVTSVAKSPMKFWCRKFIDLSSARSRNEKREPEAPVFLRRLKAFFDDFAECLFGCHAAAHERGDLSRVFADGIGQGGAVVLEIFVFLSIDQILGAGSSTRCAHAAGACDTATAAAAGGLESAGLGQTDLIDGEDASGIAWCEFAFFRMVQMMVAIERHFFASAVGQFIARTVAGSDEGELHTLTVGFHLVNDAVEIGAFEGLNITVPTFASCRSQNMYFQ